MPVESNAIEVLPIPRLRMFAGPNGSGKSSMKSVLPSNLLGQYINPDEIESQIEATGFFDFDQFGLTVSAAETLDYLVSSPFLAGVGLTSEAKKIACVASRLSFENVSVNSYFASVIADFTRRIHLQNRLSFTFETVMSSADKVRLLQDAQNFGYRTYLYYVATEDPLINIARVQNRVALGGHSVPQEKIVSRYARSLELLFEAIQATHRAYIFDNSGVELMWIAEITNGREVQLRSSSVPEWFRIAILDKITF